MRISRGELDNDVVMGMVEIGKPVKVRDRLGGGYMEVHNLKFRNPTAWENHYCEIRIEGKAARINVGDLIKALRFA